MSWLDNVVAWISPEAGAKRAAWRKLAGRSGWKLAEDGRRAPIRNGWIPGKTEFIL